MKKNNSYLADDEIDLVNLIKSLWREKTLILSISIICGLLSFFYASIKIQILKTEIIIRNPPPQIFEYYNPTNPMNNNPQKSTTEQYISDFKTNFLSLDNLKSFFEKNREFDYFKRYLQSRNISVEQYFSAHKLRQVEEKNIIIPNKYFINHSKELDGATFLNKYAEFTKEKTITEFKNILKLTFINVINYHQEALEIAKKIQLEYPIIKSPNQLVSSEPEALFYKGTKVLSENINYLNKKLIKLEDDQFNYINITQKAITLKNPIILPLYFALGLILGLFLSLGIILFKGTLKK